MNAKATLQQLRRFLLGLVAFIFLGTLVELVLVSHYEESLQWIPFIMSVLGLGVVLAARYTAGGTGLRLLRWVMAGVILTSLLGMALHFYSNYSFVREINPSYSVGQALWPALKGSHPLLAPGILLLAGVLGIAATWRHPALES